MTANPLLGVFFHWLGGLASGSFYVPYKAVRKWSWETYWLVGGFFSWIIAPWILAFLNTRDLLAVLGEAPGGAVFWAYFWGAMWGLGGLTFGLTMRYLGMSLGMAVALGYCAAFGTLMPPLFKGEMWEIINTTSGMIILAGVAVCLCGIAIAGIAGMSKEKEMPAEAKRATIKEFNFVKGILVATFSGIMSASMSYGLSAAEPIADISAAHGTSVIWTGLPKLVIVLLGGFTTNFIWCVLLNIKNRSGAEYFRAEKRVQLAAAGAAAAAGGSDSAVAVADPPASTIDRAPMLNNYFFAALAGTTWYMQFFFYTMGETQMGQFKFSSWTLHMASIIIFSTLWGIALHEWRGSSRKTHWLIAMGLAVLIGSTLIVGYGNYEKPAVGSMVALTDGQVSIKTGDEKLTFKYDQDTAVTIDGKSARLSDAKPGQELVITSRGQKTEFTLDEYTVVRLDGAEGPLSFAKLGQTVQVEPKKLEAFTCDKSTKVVIGGKPGTLTDIKPGQTLLVESRGDRVATKILAKAK